MAPASSTAEVLLDIKDLSVQFATEDGLVRAVDGVNFTVRRGQSVGIVGESGSGKSVSMLTIMGLSRSRNANISGTAMFEGTDLLQATDSELRKIRGDDIAMIFQDPLSSLHPFYKVGWQLVEAIRAHRDVSKRQARERAIELLGLVGIPSPRERVDSYPHEFSGGMRQRAMIAMALSNEPKLLIADEPTTALDVTVQAQILELVARLQQELNMALVLITHDLGVVAQVTEEVNVMYAGEVVESAPTERIFAAPQHPYTWGLLRSIPRLDRPRDEPLVPIPGRPPSLVDPPKGCRFFPRCPYEPAEARETHPNLEQAADEAGHTVRCHLAATTRRQIWAQLKEGKSPEDVKRSMTVETGAG
ncbi:MAG: peptide/nickel transport system ATP-binding protein [Thermoleophilaceae bacterium]|nr:peptide/nickel transport system ATP-binding protein [Thermoleophilaceae bacterium]